MKPPFKIGQTWAWEHYPVPAPTFRIVNIDNNYIYFIKSPGPGDSIREAITIWTGHLIDESNFICISEQLENDISKTTEKFNRFNSIEI